MVVEKLVGNARGISRAGKPSKTKEQKQSEEYYRRELEDMKIALQSEDAMQQFEDEYGYEPTREDLKQLQIKLQYKNPETSMVKRDNKPLLIIPGNISKNY